MRGVCDIALPAVRALEPLPARALSGADATDATRAVSKVGTSAQVVTCLRGAIVAPLQRQRGDRQASQIGTVAAGLARRAADAKHLSIVVAGSTCAVFLATTALGGPHVVSAWLAPVWVVCKSALCWRTRGLCDEVAGPAFLWHTFSGQADALAQPSEVILDPVPSSRARHALCAAVHPLPCLAARCAAGCLPPRWRRRGRRRRRLRWNCGGGHERRQQGRRQRWWRRGRRTGRQQGWQSGRLLRRR